MNSVEEDLLTLAPLKERATSLATIAAWERKIRILFQDYADKTEIDRDSDDSSSTTTEDEREELDAQEEHLQEDLEGLRSDLLESLKAQFAAVERDIPSKAYEAILYTLLLDRMRRNFGYFSAISRARVATQSMNSHVGDQVFDIDVPKLTKLLSSIDEVYFVRQLCLGLGLAPSKIDNIVDFQIEREFKPRSK